MTRLESKGKHPDTGQRLWKLHLLKVEAAILRGLPEQLRQLLANPDNNRPVVDRLFPVSYADPEEERENRRLLGQGLLEERQHLLDLMDAEMLRAEPSESQTDSGDQADQGDQADKGDQAGVALELDAAQLDLWLRFVNDVRLVLATDLGMDSADSGPDSTADPQPPEDPKRALLEYLGGLESILVEAARQDF
ncbi:MAG: hypothetical protein DHS20C15_09030 [Planctomycetota bacterium]|nr:MAG: hypothetical protein DHS20C15_09030 [Planctomycetota bacterium]